MGKRWTIFSTVELAALILAENKALFELAMGEKVVVRGGEEHKIPS